MVKTFNVDRTKGGTYSFKLDAQGNYTLQKDGFNKVKTLNLPELKAEATKTTTTQDTKTASAQTKEAFGDVRPFYYPNRGDGQDNQYTTEYKMTKDKSLDTNIDQTSFKPNMLDVSGPVKKPVSDKFAKSIGPQKVNIPTEKKQISRVNKDDYLFPGVSKQDVESVKQPDRFGTEFSRPEAGTIDQMAKDAMSVPGKTTVSDLQKQSQLGVRVPDRISSRLRPAIEKTTLPETALKAVKTTSNVLSKAFNFTFKTPAMMALDMIAGPPTATQTHAQGYFNVRGGNVDGGRISGNPATDLYAGMNRVSKFGNLEKAGAKRIATREKTIAKKGYGPGDKFYEDTQNMKNQQDKYTRDKHKAVAKDAVKKGANPNNPSEMRAASIKASNEKGNSGNGGGGGGRVICTELHSTGEMSTVDWVRDTRFTFKTLTKSHVKGYLFWAIPTVRHMKKYPLYRKIWKHIAQHRANDIAWRLGESKFDLLGRIYAGIGEPTCWLIGKFVSDKQYNELNLKNWRKA